MTVATWVLAVATVLLAAGAIVTVYYARRAFLDQAAELSELRKQGEDQHKVNEKQVTVLELQTRELSESLDERKRQAEEQRRAQAETIDLTWDAMPGSSMVVVINGSRRPIRSVTCVVYPESSDLTLPPASWGEMFPPTRERDGWTLRDTTDDGPQIIYALRAGGRAGFAFPRPRHALREAEVQFNDDAGLRWALNNELHLRQL